MAQPAIGEGDTGTHLQLDGMKTEQRPFRHRNHHPGSQEMHLAASTAALVAVTPASEQWTGAAEEGSDKEAVRPLLQLPDPIVQPPQQLHVSLLQTASSSPAGERSETAAPEEPAGMAAPRTALPCPRLSSSRATEPQEPYLAVAAGEGATVALPSRCWRAREESPINVVVDTCGEFGLFICQRLWHQPLVGELSPLYWLPALRNSVHLDLSIGTCLALSQNSTGHHSVALSC